MTPLPISNWRVTNQTIGNRQLKIGNGLVVLTLRNLKTIHTPEAVLGVLSDPRQHTHGVVAVTKNVVAGREDNAWYTPVFISSNCFTSNL